MKKLSVLMLGVILIACTPKKDHPTVRSILLEQLQNSHTNEDWYVPIKVAVQGLSSEQSNWKDSTENHSIGQLVSHLIFWNERILTAFHGNTPPDFNDDNKITFELFDAEGWEVAVQQLDSIQVQWERSVEAATEEQLREWSSSIANICSHNAYHTGQIVYIRKQNGWWH